MRKALIIIDGVSGEVIINGAFEMFQGFTGGSIECKRGLIYADTKFYRLYFDRIEFP